MVSGSSRSVFVSVLVAATLCLTRDAVGAGDWIRGVRGVSNGYEPLMMETIEERWGHLVATGSYREYREEKRANFPSTLQGLQKQGCGFWPEMVGEVTNDLKGEWRTIEKKKPEGQPTTVTLRWKNPNVWLHFDLDGFRPMIGKFRYGRIRLSNGDVATFELQSLSRPSRPAHAWDITPEFADGEPYTPPFAVANIGSMGEDLDAMCEYLEMKATTVTDIEGTATPDGNFWPYVVAQVADDYYGIWKTIGEPASIGKPMTLSIQPKDTKARLLVDLQIFRPLIGQFRYGRLVLKNGKAAPFELKNLLPPEDEETSEKQPGRP